MVVPSLNIVWFNQQIMPLCMDEQMLCQRCSCEPSAQSIVASSLARVRVLAYAVLAPLVPLPVCGGAAPPVPFANPCASACGTRGSPSSCRSAWTNRCFVSDAVASLPPRALLLARSHARECLHTQWHWVLSLLASASLIRLANPPLSVLVRLPLERRPPVEAMAPKAAPKHGQKYQRRRHPTVGVTGDTQATGADHWMVPTMRRLEDPTQAAVFSHGPVPDSELQAQRFEHRRISGLRNAGFSPGRHVDYVNGRPVLVRAACLPQA